MEKGAITIIFSKNCDKKEKEKLLKKLKHLCRSTVEHEGFIYMIEDINKVLNEKKKRDVAIQTELDSRPCSPSVFSGCKSRNELYKI